MVEVHVGEFVGEGDGAFPNPKFLMLAVEDPIVPKVVIVLVSICRHFLLAGERGLIVAVVKRGSVRDGDA